MKAGTFINSSSLLDGTPFEKAVILITEYNDKGAMGFIINKPYPRKLNELEEFKQCFPFPLQDGGPVDKQHLFFIHQRPDLIAGGKLIANNLYLGGDFKEAVMQINNKSITEKDLRIFVGYCGWDNQELEDEINEGSWAIIKEASVSAFI